MSIKGFSPYRRELELLGVLEGPEGSLFQDFPLFLRRGFFYCLDKLRLLLLLPPTLLQGLLGAGISFKSYATRKLIFGRGKLSRPVSQISVVGLAVLVFLVGGTGWAQSREAVAPFGREEDILVAGGVGGPVTYTNSASGEVLTYTVEPGDTLSSIGEKFKVSISSIRYANNLTNIDYLKPGQELKIPPVSGVLHTVRKGDTVESLAKKYGVSPQSIVDFNYLFAPFTLAAGQTLVIPGGEIPSPKPAPVKRPHQLASKGERYGGKVPSLGTGRFMWPTNTHAISQYFSRWHPAIDIPKFSPIYAIDSGTVIDVRYSGWNYGYGKMIRIDHGNGYTSLYAHLSSINVRAGQKVSRGQILGNMGATGRAFGTHLHLEITKNGHHINPLSVL